MKKAIFTLILFVIAISNSIGQNLNYVAANSEVRQIHQNDETPLEWIFHFNKDAGIGGTGPNIETKIAAGARFDQEFLSNYIGKNITAIAIGLRYAWDNVTLYVKKGNDISTAETIITQQFNHLGAGWNYIMLDSPVEINGEETINIEYGGITDESVIGIDINNKAKRGCSFIYLAGAYYDMADINSGNTMIKALVNGDSEELANCVSLDKISGLPDIAPQNSVLDIELSMSNNSFKEVSDITITYTIDGKQYNEDVSFTEKVEPYKTFLHNIEINVPDHDFDLELYVSKVNGKDNLSIQPIKQSIMVYEPDNTGDRTILIEKFTGQDCSICPSGEERIQEAISGVENRVARIDHHYGYYNDLFTIEESEIIGSFFGVKGAPSCMVNRAKVEGQNDVVFHPGNLKGTTVFKEMLKPANITVKIETAYNKDSRNLRITVKGESKMDLTDKRINVVITQSGYEAYQNNGEDGYLHNDFPIIYLTEYNGDALSVKQDGSYNMTFECDIPESFTNENGTRIVDINQLKVVAFIADWKDKDNSEVMNAAFLKIDPEKADIRNTTTKTPEFTIIDGTVTTEACCSSIEVYDLSGARIANKHLTKGIYIVKAECNNRIYTQKVVAD